MNSDLTLINHYQMLYKTDEKYCQSMKKDESSNLKQKTDLPNMHLNFQ